MTLRRTARNSPTSGRVPAVRGLLQDDRHCYEDHAVYLAAFAPDTFKVGVTREWRLHTRLREQGADRAAHVRTVADGRVARQVEADIAVELGDRVRVPTKISGFDQSVDTDWWASPVARRRLHLRLRGASQAVEHGSLAEALATGTVRG